VKYNKILIIGASGSGKSTLAQQIARELGITYVATDPFYWDIDWQPVSDETVYTRVLEALQHPNWSMDGNFDSLRELVWKEADCIIWLNLPFIIVAYRVIIRNLRWWLTQEKIWSGNRMTLKHAFSEVRHAIRSYWKKKRNYPIWLKEEPNVVVFTSSRQARKFLQNLGM
jgi:cytidylate kinase